MDEERTVDAELAEELATRYIRTDAILEALEGYLDKEARGLLKWAHGTDSPEKALLAWGRKHGASRDRERRREAATRRGRKKALEEPLRATFRKLLATEYLLSRRKAALEGTSYDEEIQAILDVGTSMWDSERIRYETTVLKASCAEKHPPETLEEDLGFDSADERALEERVSAGNEPSVEDRRQVELYELGAGALVEELRGQVDYLEARLEKALTGYLKDPAKYIRCESKGLPYVPREYDR